jgi:hypothetical protein
MNLSNRIFLLLIIVFESYAVCFAIFCGSPQFDKLVVDKLCAKHARFKYFFFCFSKYLAYPYKMRIIIYPLQGLLPETGLLNKKSRAPVLHPLISYVVSWTQSLIDRKIETKQLHPIRLTQGSIAHRYFWEGGQVRFPALSSLPHSKYFRWPANTIEIHMPNLSPIRTRTLQIRMSVNKKKKKKELRKNN